MSSKFIILGLNENYNKRMKRIFILFILLTIISGCAPFPVEKTVVTQSSEVPTLQPPIGKPTEISPSKPEYSLTSPCNLPPITIPTLPAVIPGYAELDNTTGLHMTQYVKNIDLTTYRLKVSGLVDHPLELNFEELRCFPKVTVKAKIVCPGYFIDESTWSGVSFATLLEKAGLQKKAKQVVLIGTDGYQATISLNDVLNEHNFLAYEMINQPLPILHGFPVRAVFPQLEGYAWVKSLVEINIR
jgi:DMSO/TMAO reductase YedYZ molybdopterin-dependent catalytic subunit